MGGLRPSIQQVVESRYASQTDKVMLLNAAKEAEIAVSVGPDKRLMELEAEIAAFRVSPGSSPGRGGGQAGWGGRGASRGGGSGAPRFNQQQQQGQSQQAQGQSSELTHHEKVRLRKNWIICHKCYQWGKHRANECKLSATQIQKLTPQDGDVRPTGVPFDTQFDPKNEILRCVGRSHNAMGSRS